MATTNRYLLISGAPKCGTTSLFRYLSDHPDVCQSHRKETYFFAREFDLKKVCQTGERLEDFEDYFSHCDFDSKLRLEATPYTLYAKEAPQKIASLLENVFVLFILRDPVKRLISDYQFHVQRGHPSTANSIEDFLIWQRRMTGDIPGLIDQGCYIRFLHNFINTLSKDRIIILIFEDLISNPKEEMQKLCLLLDINDAFYSTYNFKTHNPTINYRFSILNHLYMNFEPSVANIRSSLMNRPKINTLIERFIDLGKSAYRLVNSKKSGGQAVFPSQILSHLITYYQPYNQLLSEEIGRLLPWKEVDGDDEPL